MELPEKSRESHASKQNKQLCSNQRSRDSERNEASVQNEIKNYKKELCSIRILTSIFTSRCFITEILDPKLYQVVSFMPIQSPHSQRYGTSGDILPTSLDKLPWHNNLARSFRSRSTTRKAFALRKILWGIYCFLFFCQTAVNS